MNTTHVESDEWLMGRVRRGDRSALEKLVRRYASPLLTFIRRMVHDVHRSEELFQDVFLRVWTKRRQYRLQNAFRSWLFAIAANRCRDEFRRRSPTPVPDVDQAPATSRDDDDDGPTATAIRTETATIVSQAVARLPPQQRTVVVMRIWNGLSYAEIADVLGTEEGTVPLEHCTAPLASVKRVLEPKLK